MPTYVHSKKARIVHGKIDLSPWMNEVTGSVSVDTGDTSHFGSEAKTYIYGQNDATLSGGGLYDGSLGGIQPYFETIIDDATVGGLPVPITFAPEGLVIGGFAFMVIAKQTSYEVNTVISDVETVAFQTQADGGASFGVVLSTDATVSVTTDLASVDNLALSSLGGRFFGHILSNANTGNVTLTLQHSTNNSVWVDLSVLPVVTTGTLTAYRSATFSGTVNRYLRLRVTLAGTGAVSVTASASRN